MHYQASSTPLLVKARQLIHEYTFGEIRDLFSRSGIKVLVLKGPHLGAVAYASPEKREYGDLDLLVMPSDFLPAAGILRDAGFEIFPTHDQLASWKRQAAWLFRSPRGVYVDLHRGFSEHGWPLVDPKALFERAEYFFFGETRASGLERHDLLLHLCIHAGKRAFSTLARKHLLDIACLLKAQAPDWVLFGQRAAAARARTVSFYALEAVRRQYHTDIPAALLRGLRPGAIRRVLLGRALDPSCFPMARFSTEKGALRRWYSLLLIDPVPKMALYLSRFLAVQLQGRRLRRDNFRRIWLKKNPEIRDFLK